MSFKLEFLSSIILVINFLRELSLNFPFVFGLVSMFFFGRVFFVTRLFFKRDSSRQPSFLISSYIVGTTFFAFHLHSTQILFERSTKFQFLEALIESYYSSRKEILILGDELKKRDAFFENMKNGNNPQWIEKKELKTLKIFEKGIELDYFLEKVDGKDRLLSFCSKAEDLLINKFEIETYGFSTHLNLSKDKKSESGVGALMPNNDVIEDLMKEINSLKHACNDVELSKVEEMKRSYLSFSQIIPNDLMFYLRQPPFIFKLVPELREFASPLDFKKNEKLKFYYFDEKVDNSLDLCLFQLLNSSKMSEATYHVTSMKGLFSSFTSERVLDDRVKFYSSPFESNRFFCLFAKQKEWTNIFPGVLK